MKPCHSRSVEVDMGKERDRGDKSYNCYFGWPDSLKDFEELGLKALMRIQGLVWRNQQTLLRFLSMHRRMHHQSSN